MTDTASPRREHPTRARAALRVAVALVAAVTVMVVGLAGLFASSASARTLAGPETGVGVFGAAGGQVVGADEPVLAGQRRARAPDYDRMAVGSCVAAEEGAIPAGSTADAATSGSRITSSVRGQYFQEGAEPPTCSYCQQNPAEHLDHVIPRSQGGDLTPENLTPACEWCNLSKGARVAPVNPPAGYVGEWPPSFWPDRMTNWWYSTYGGSP